MTVPTWLRKLVAWILRRKEIQDYVDEKIENVIEEKTGYKIDVPTDGVANAIADKIEE